MSKNKTLERIQVALEKVQDICTKTNHETKGTAKEDSIWNEIYDELHGLILRIEASK